MKLNFKIMPVGCLPYNDIQLCKKMMLKLFEKLPFIPELTLINNTDDALHRTLVGVQYITEKDGKLLLPESGSDGFVNTLVSLEKTYNSDKKSDFGQYAFDAPFFELFDAMLEKFQPEYTYFNIIGPFTLANMIFNKKASIILLDKIYRKYIVYSIANKALWFIHHVKSISPQTKPIIMFDENLLYKFGTLKRTNENITNELITMLFTRIFERIKKEGAIIGVQSFEKCNWQLLFDTKFVDIISFDAYNNTNNLSILAPNVNNFLAKGGILNWGIVPVTNENAIRTLNFDNLYTKLISSIESLASQGVSADLLYKNSTVSVQGDLNNYPILFAENALIMADKIAKRLPISSGTIQHNS